jgi:hypothetical protein
MPALHIMVQNSKDFGNILVLLFSAEEFDTPVL